jgi:hypothetical protein
MLRLLQILLALLPQALEPLPPLLLLLRRICGMAAPMHLPHALSPVLRFLPPALVWIPPKQPRTPLTQTL